MKSDRWNISVALGLLMFIAYPIATSASPTVIPAMSLYAAAADKGADKSGDKPDFSGNASWYGQPFHGRKTASGEIFDMNKLSAAHKTLPFPTKVMVENPKNGQSCVIRVTDRGPFVRGRVLDLSREAAKRLGTFPGVGYVEATVLPNKPEAKDKK
ncbi:MAG TPA: septal ring lytic transglycosylase RlpA family protein [Drouetiella sp.]